MKKFFAAACCTLLIAGTSFAQEATPVAAAAEAVQAVATDAVQAVATESATAVVTESAPVVVSEAAPVVVPMTSSFVEGTVVNAPISSEYQMAPVQSACGCSGTPVMSQSVVSAPMASTAPVMTAPAASSCGCNAAPAPAAPVSSCGCGTPAPAAAPACCQSRERRQVVRGAVSGLRSRRTSSCCN